MPLVGVGNSLISSRTSWHDLTAPEELSCAALDGVVVSGRRD